MKRVFARLAAVAATLPLALGAAAGTASAGDTTLPGCYGAGVVVCNLTITIGAPIGVGTYQSTLPVCAGTCVEVPITWVGTTPGEPLKACYRYNDYYGATFSYCAVGGDGGGGGGVVGTVEEILDNIDVQWVVDEVRALRYELQERVERLLAGDDACVIVASALNRVTGEDQFACM